MIVIILYIFSFLLLHYIAKNFSYKTRVQLEIIGSFALLCIFFCFRGLPVLNDTNHYYQAQILKLNDRDLPWFYYEPLSKWRPGFQIFQQILIKVWPDPYALIFISSLIFSIGSIWFVKKNTSQVAVTIFFMLGLGAMFGQYAAMRQSCAMMGLYVGCYCLMKKKYIYSFFFLLLATQFHASVECMFLFFVLTFIEPSKHNIRIVLLICVVLLAALFPILNMFDYGDNHYVTDSIERGAIAVTGIINTSFLGLAMLSTIKLKKKYNIQSPHKVIVWGAILCIFFNAASTIVMVFDRFALYLVIFNVIHFLHYVFRAPRNVGRQFLLIAIMVVLFRTIGEIGLKNEWKHLVPYSFFEFGKIYDLDFGY